MWRNGTTCIYMFMFPLKNLARKGLTLVQVIACCPQTTRHYLSQCWPRFISPCGITIEANELINLILSGAIMTESCITWYGIYNTTVTEAEINRMWCVYSSEKLFQCSQEGYSSVYFPICEATREMNTKIILEWVQKQFDTRVHTLSYFLHDITNP